MIAVVDYGMGNLRSVQKGLERVGAKAEVTGNPEQVARAEAVVLPGVGAFGRARQNLKASGLEAAVLEAIASEKPFLGVCLGLQLLFSESEESGGQEGLGIVPGRVVRFFGDGPAPLGPDGSPLKVPHMGWNRVRAIRPCPLFEGLPEEAMFYFVHSYYAIPSQEGWAVAVTDHGLEFASALWRQNLFAVQFHPEKSGAIGLRLLANFARMAKG